MPIKTFVIGLFLAIDALCRYFIRYHATFLPILKDHLSDADYQTVVDWLNKVQEVCALVGGVAKLIQGL